MKTADYPETHFIAHRFYDGIRSGLDPFWAGVSESPFLTATDVIDALVEDFRDEDLPTRKILRVWYCAGDRRHDVTDWAIGCLEAIAEAGEWVDPAPLPAMEGV